MASTVMHPSKVKKSTKVKKTSRSKKSAKVKGSAPGKGKSNSNAPVSDRIFPFLELPRELRDMIYEYVALSSPTILPRSTRNRDLKNACPLMAVSRQLREEFSSMLITHATPIRTTVVDFNFAHVVRFLNTLSERELNMLPSLKAPSKRKFIVTLDATFDPNEYSDMFGRWLRRCEHPTKRGTNIDIRYVFPRRLAPRPSLHMGPTPVFMDHSLVVSMRKKINEKIGRLVLVNLPGRMMDELKKMRAAEIEELDEGS